MKRRWEAHSNDRGATVVEFALVLPLLLVLIIALIDFGRIGFIEVSITSASREGARLSSFYPAGTTNNQDIINLVEAAAPGAAAVAQLDSNAALTINTSPCTSVPDDNTLVTVSTNFNWLLPIDLVRVVSPGSTLGQGIVLSSTSAMRCGN